eukprot:SAG22_NODE_9471_length_588_cov_0.730061_2_plen_91_part_01
MVEKKEAVDIWERIVNLAKSTRGGSAAFRDELVTTSVYGDLLSKVIYFGWSVMTLGYEGELTGTFDKRALASAIGGYDSACMEYNETLKTM